MSFSSGRWQLLVPINSEPSQESWSPIKVLRPSPVEAGGGRAHEAAARGHLRQHRGHGVQGEEEGLAQLGLQAGAGRSVDRRQWCGRPRHCLNSPEGHLRLLLPV